MIGKPKYKLGDVVTFFWGGLKNGTISVVDHNGTFENDTDVSYDIFVEKENTLYKHIPESIIQ